MRTTLSLDDDIAGLLEKEVQRSGESFKGVVNRLLRLGLMAAHHQRPQKKFVVKARKIRLPRTLSYDKPEEILEFLEGPFHK